MNSFYIQILIYIYKKQSINKSIFLTPNFWTVVCVCVCVCVCVWVCACVCVFVLFGDATVIAQLHISPVRLFEVILKE